MKALATTLLLLGMSGMASYVAHFVWASFHTAEGTSQWMALFSRMTVLDRTRFTPRGQAILRRMWLSLLFGIGCLALGMVVAGYAREGSPPR